MPLFIHETSAVDMCKSFAANELIMVIAPCRKVVIATAMVTDMTNKHSWNVEEKHFGRALGFSWLYVRERAVPDSASASLSAPIVAETLRPGKM